MMNFLIAPDFSPEHFAGWHILNTYLQNLTEQPMRLLTPNSHREQMQLLKQNAVTLIYANPFDAAQLVREQGYMALAHPTGRHDEMLIASHAESHYTHSDQLQAGCKILVTENEDLHLIGLRLLESADLSEEDIEWIRCDTFQEAARRLINHEADAAFFLASTYQHFRASTTQNLKILMQSRINDLTHVLLLHPQYADWHDVFTHAFTLLHNTPAGQQILHDLDIDAFVAMPQDEVEFMIDLLETLKD